MELAKLELLNFLEEDSKYRVGVIHLDVVDSIEYVKLNSMTGMDYKSVIEGFEDLIMLVDGIEYFPYLKFKKLKKRRQSSNNMVVYIHFKDFSGKSDK